jgi:hypothetical protein
MKRWLFLILLLAFALRLYHLDTVPLRGDEAFAVRYWAQPLPDLTRGEDSLAHKEPHPFGTFVIFWGWKQLAGDSEFAMRCLPLLINWLGTAVIAALALRLFRDRRIACLAALLWAINPFLIWHAQDVRNYALWATLSPLALWLFLRASASDRHRDWILYIVAETLALYMFFFEPLLMVVQGIYVLLLRRQAMRRAIIAWITIGLLLIPWLVQVWWLSNSGYKGTQLASDPVKLLTWFLPTLLIGEQTWALGLSLLVAALIGYGVVRQSHESRSRLLWLGSWIAVPSALLLIVGSRVNVFHPRYLIALTPALIILIARAAVGKHRLAVIVLLIPLVGLNNLATYYRGDDPKSADWRALTAYLNQRVQPNDMILQVMADPTFKYYYRADTPETSLNGDPNQLADLTGDYATIWLIGRSPDTESYLGEHMQTISQDAISNFTIIQYRQETITRDEIQHPVDMQFGDIVRLVGYTLQGSTVILYWEPLRQTEIEYTVFVHLIGPPHPGPRWDQDDHPPRYGTRIWAVGELIRDPYHLALNVPAGHYSLEVGIYDPADPNNPLPVTDANGASIGTSYPLQTLTLP